MNNKRLLASVLGCVLAGALVGCGGSDSSNSLRIENPDPEVDERLDALGIACETTLLLSGSFVKTDPDDISECPDGTWSFTVTKDFTGCNPQPALSDEFAYLSTTDEEASTTVSYLNDPDNEDVGFKINVEGGSALCYGHFDHFFDDGTVYSFHPAIYADGTLDGTGTYSVYE